MKHIQLLAILFASFALQSVGFSQTTQRAAADEEEDIIYRPPTASAGNARMGGGSRSDVKLPVVVALVPDHAGRTSNAKPNLYWYCSEATTLPREFSLVDSTTLDTVKRVSMEAPIEAGLQKIELGSLDVELTKDATYEWRIAVVANTTNRSDNAVAGGMIQHVVVPMPAIAEPPLKHAARLAAAGLWYDALDQVMSQLAQDPSARPLLVKLLEQVKLDEVADFARK